MPEVPTTVKRQSLDDFVRQQRQGTIGKDQKQVAFDRNSSPIPQRTGMTDAPARERVAEISRKLEGDQPEAEMPALGGQQPPVEASAATEAPAEPTDVQEARAGLSDAEVLAKFREWEASDLYPDELMAKMHPVKVRGEERYVDTEELRKGYIRYSDYQARGSELKTREAEVGKYKTVMDQHFSAIKDPDVFLDTYERNGYGSQLEKVAERLMARRQERDELVHAAGYAAALRAGYTPEQIAAGHAEPNRDRNVYEAMKRAREQFEHGRKIDIESRKLTAERERLDSEREQARIAEATKTHHATFDRQLAQLRPAAFKAHGFEDTSQNRDAFMLHLKEVIDSEGGLPPEGFNRGLIMNAAQLMRERLADKNQTLRNYLTPQEQRAAEQAQARRGQPLSPTRAGTGGGRTVINPGSKSQSVDDFTRQYHNRRMGR